MNHSYTRNERPDQRGLRLTGFDIGEEMKMTRNERPDQRGLQLSGLRHSVGRSCLPE